MPSQFLLRWYFYVKGDEFMKVWKDACDIKMIHDFDNKKLRDLDKEMRKKPNFDKFEGGQEWCKHGKKKYEVCIKTHQECKRCKENDSIFGS